MQRLALMVRNGTDKEEKKKLDKEKRKCKIRLPKTVGIVLAVQMAFS